MCTYKVGVRPPTPKRGGQFIPEITSRSIPGGLARLSYLGRQVKLVDDVNLEKHLEHDLASVEVVEVDVDEVEVEQPVVVRRLQFKHLSVRNSDETYRACPDRQRLLCN